MSPSIQSLWIVLTVMVPGIVTYGTFRVLVEFQGYDISFLERLDASEGLSISVVVAVMFILQMFGIALESIAFKCGPYRHHKPECQNAFKKRYEIIATMDPQEGCHIERILAQFFMSHNIAVGMIINLVWFLSYELVVRKGTHGTTNVVGAVILTITILSIYVPYNRFDQACRALVAYVEKQQDIESPREVIERKSTLS